MNTVIIDDDVDFANILKNNLHETTTFQVVEMAHSVKDGLAAIMENKPDVVFLDMELPDGEGFDVIKDFDEIPFQLVVISAHDQYAMRAFKFSAVDYLLKPFEVSELHRAIQRIEKLKSHEVNSANVFLNNHRTTSLQSKKLGVSTVSDIYYIRLREISFAKADGNYTEIFLVDQKKCIVSSKPIKYFEEVLEEFDFFRVHKSYLVNLRNVKSYKKSDGGYLVMKDGSTVDISRVKKDELLKKLESI
ncbi:MAG: response regulator transcription factor [Cryomorphaceae bacterium]|nr:response regulator transcription factor [Cryomorphaceae bacterium]